MTGPQALLDVAQQVAAAAGQVASSWREHADALRPQEKDGPADLVSQADRDAEAAARAVLTDLRPDDAVLGEEAGCTPGTSGVRWVLDPVDGTTNYLYGRPDWAVSVAAVSEADGALLAGVVAQPALARTTAARAGGGTRTDGVAVAVRRPGELRLALVELGLGRSPLRARAGRLLDAVLPEVRDVRRGGSAATSLVHVATGLVDAYWGPDLQPWDSAAGVLLVREAGGLVGDLDGVVLEGVPDSGHVLAAAPELFEPLRALLAEVYRG